MILSKQGVTQDMKFVCCDCGDTVTGQQVIDGEGLHIVSINKENRMNSTFRCEICHEDRYDDCNCE